MLGARSKVGGIGSRYEAEENFYLYFFHCLQPCQRHSYIGWQFNVLGILRWLFEIQNDSLKDRVTLCFTQWLFVLYNDSLEDKVTLCFTQWLFGRVMCINCKLLEESCALIANYFLTLLLNLQLIFKLSEFFYGDSFGKKICSLLICANILQNDFFFVYQIPNEMMS